MTMADVGVLTSAVLCVKHKRKKRLCTLLKPATFNDSLKLLVMDNESNSCLIEDVIHAFLWFLDPNHHSTLMLVCDYKVRCISFDCIEDLTTWVELLKKHLKCNYFHADLVLASKKSSLYNHARRRCRQLRCDPSHKRSHSNLGTNGTGMFRVSAACSDGYLHVTRDRICFTTGPNCARPRILACWSFENDDLIQCGTARAKSEVIESDSYFFLTASPDHPEAPGGHLFISDRANDLCERIETNSRTAIYQAEWRRFTSIAMVLDTTCLPSSPTTASPQHTVVNPPPNGLIEHPPSFTVLRSTNLSNLRSKQCLSHGCHPSFCQHPMPEHTSECGQEQGASNPLAAVSTEHAQIEQQLQEALDEVSDGDSQGSAPLSSLSATSSLHEQEVQFPAHEHTDSGGQVDIPRLTTDYSPHALHFSKEPHSTDKGPSANCLIQAEFAARKRNAMNSRRRFSSHPVDFRGMYPFAANPFGYQCLPGERLSTHHNSARTSLGPTTCSFHNTPHSHSSCSASESHLLLGHGWRQSEPQLVTLPSHPVPLYELDCFLRRLKGEHPHLHRSPQTCETAALHPLPCQAAIECKCSRNEDTVASKSSFGVTTCHRLSECSTTSTNELLHSSQQSSQRSCPQCISTFDAGEGQLSLAGSVTQSAEPPAFGVPTNRRKRLPSSWSTAISAPHRTDPTRHHIRTQSDTFHGTQPPLLNRSFSSGSSPQCTYTPLLPTSIVIPGSQYFFYQRCHTASTSEAVVPLSNQDPGVFDDSSVSIALASQNSFRPTAKASLVSLSPSSLPLWAEAPGSSKPRTGRNYVSREALLALHSQRKLHQSSDPSSPSGDRHPDDQPEIAGTQAQSHSFSESLGESTQSSVLNPPMEPNSLSCPNDTSTTESQRTETPQAVGQELSQFGRSYINVGPNRRVSLQPIDEREAMRSVLVQPIASNNRDLLTNEDATNFTRLPDLDEGASGSVITLCSYVNVSDLSKSVSGIGTSSASSSFSSSMPPVAVPPVSSQYYVNLASRATTISLDESSHGLRSIPQHFQQSIHDTHRSHEADYVVPIPSTSPTCSTRITCDAIASQAHRLHYAHLTLSTGQAWRPFATSGQSTASPTPCHSGTVKCLSESRGSESIPSSLPCVSHDPPTCGPSSSKGIAPDDDGDSSSAGLNYVTIDLFQTKALSEVEKELRLHTASETASRSLFQAGRQQRWRSNSRRGLVASNTLLSNMPHDTPSGPGNACHSGLHSTDNLCPSSLSSRIFHRLVASFHPQGAFARKSSSTSGCRHLHQFGKAV
ncbi:unnamed protein product [Dicrocoelium dendriticum]|nr:unnamed protein product [Dicrocoelium dendriticum]